MKIFKTISIFIFCLIQLQSCSDDDTKIIEMDADFSADAQNISAGESIQFTDLSIGDVTKWDWSFEGGTPPTSNLQSPVIVYNTAGTYAVTLRVSNSEQSETIAKESFIVVSSPQVTANFEVSANNVLQGENLVFTDNSTGNPTSWLWEFIPESGETITSTEQNPVIAFDQPGLYSVKLKASNSDNSDEFVATNIFTVVDSSSLEADFTASQTYGYTGGMVNFTDTSVGNVQEYNWSFEGATPSSSNEMNPSVSYDSAGRYTVSLTISSDNGTSTITKENLIIIVPGDNLAAFFPFDGNSDDVGPNNLSSNTVGVIGFSDIDRNGMENQVGVFDGESTLLVTDNPATNFATDDYTIGVWIKTDDISKMMVWQESGANGPGDNQSWVRIGDNTESRILRFATEDSTGGAIMNIGTADITNGVANGLWHYVVAVREGVNTRVYVDGVFIQEKTGTNVKNVSNEQDFKIASQETNPGTYGNFFKGSMDEMIIYNRALSEAEILTLFNL
ncbi:PKD repeat-containing protein [Flavobacteriaceae bacterium MAR_2010_188]|nr:PKD repeat-containing protein [Flavobacteriaceae bacterium MAR_2010_188]